MKLKTEQFELMTWHDNTLHGISFVDENFANDLVLDIDYIEQWLDEAGHYRFKVAPAKLVFHEVSQLKVSLMSDGPQTMFAYLATINGIGREQIGENRYKWVVDLLGCKENSITFEASGFTQETYREAIISTSQHLTVDQRT